MLQLGRHTGLAQEALHFGRIELPLARDLNRHRAIKVRVAGLPDRTESADPESLDQLKVADRGDRRRFARVVSVAHEAETIAAGATGNVRQRRVDNDLEGITAVGTKDTESPGFCILGFLLDRLVGVTVPLGLLSAGFDQS
jgi:hypothetical protein